MKKTLNQKFRKVCKPLFLGIFLSGAMLLPTAGFFSQSPLYRSLFAANSNVAIQSDTTATLTTGNGYTAGDYVGIYQDASSITGATIVIGDQINGVIGTLDTAATGLTGVTGTQLTLSDASILTVGTTEGTSTNHGTLYITGTGTGTENASVLTISGENAGFVLNPYSTLEIGYAESSVNYSGELKFDGANFTINQTEVDINVNKYGKLTVDGDIVIGTAGSKSAITLEGGTITCDNLTDNAWDSSSNYGKITNNEGTITINKNLTWYSTLANNGTITVSGTANVQNYSDDADAKLAVAGNVTMDAASGTYDLDGTIYAGDLSGSVENLASNTGILTMIGATVTEAGSQLVAGSIALNSAKYTATGAAQFNGTVNTNSMTNTGSITFGSTTAVATEINVSGLITSDKHSYETTSSGTTTTTTYGGAITINATTAQNTATVDAAGILVNSFTDTDNDVDGGTLTLNSNATLEIAGLTNTDGTGNKFNADGTQGTGTGYYYDIYLGGILTANTGSNIKFNSDVSGIRFGANVVTTAASGSTAASTATTGSTITGTLDGKTLYLSGQGIYDSAKAVYDVTIATTGKINAANDLVLSSRVAEGATGQMGIQNIGTVTVTENLYLDGNNVYLLNGDGTKSATLSINTFDSSKGIGTDGAATGNGEIVTVAGSTTKITNLNLDANASMKLGTVTDKVTTTGGVLEVENATVDNGGKITVSGSGKIIASAAGEDKVGDLTVKSGGNIELIVESASATTAVIGGVASTGASMNLSIENGGTITTGSTTVGKNTYTNTLTLQYADVVNEGSISVKEAVSIAQSTYTGNGTINANTVSLSGSTLESGLNNTLTIAPGTTASSTATFSLADNSDISVEFGVEQGESVLAFNGVVGTVTLNAGSSVSTSNINDLEIGTYSRVLVDKSAEASSFDNAEYEKNAFQWIEKSAYGEQGDNGVLLTLHVDAKSFGELASIYGKTNNLMNMGNYIDSFEGTDKVSEDLGELITDIRGLETKVDVFNAMTKLSGTNKANSLMMAMDSPWTAAFDQMGYQTHRKASDNYEVGPAYLGQMAEGEYYENTQPAGGLGSLFGGYGQYQKNSFWGVAQHTSLAAESDGNSTDYGISNTGMTVGHDWINYDGAVVGLSFHFNLPYLYGNDHRIEMDNYHLGFYAGKKNYAGTGVKFYIDYGMQEYLSKRTVNFSGYEDFYRATFSGKSLAASFQLSHDMNINCCSLIRPLVQIDTQCVWQNAASESEGTVALNYDKADWNQTFLRAGFEGEFNTRFYRFTSRAIYGCLLNGDSAPEMTASFANVTGGSNFMVQGVDIGSAFGDLGLGAIGYLDCSRQWAISGNYDYTFSENTNAHTGAVSLSYLF